MTNWVGGVIPFIDIGILLFFNEYLIPACSKESIHLTLDHLSAGRNDILGVGRNEKKICFPDPLTINYNKNVAPVLLPRDGAGFPSSVLFGKHSRKLSGKPAPSFVSKHMSITFWN